MGEHPDIPETPEADGMTVAHVETMLNAVTLHEEHARVTDRVGNRLHCDQDPFPGGLILILEAELRAGFGGAEIQTKLFGFGVDLLYCATLGKTEFADGQFDQIQLHLFGADRDPFQDIAATVGDVVLLGHDGLAESFRILLSSQPDGFPEREVGLSGRPRIRLLFLAHGTPPFWGFSIVYPLIADFANCDEYSTP